ncbi:hypothetical protein [Sphingomonas sp.]|uniref:hypothetical protein n=1 Tax=Sphingomonas sp. TaxID=28214 RepID=UPI003B3AC05A
MTARVSCTECKRLREIDIPALIEKVGPEYSLWNRRCRCRLKKDCPGWNRFFIGPGWFTKSYDEQTEMRWIEEDWKERKAAAEREKE